MRILKIDNAERLPEAAAQFVDSLLPGRVYAFAGALGAGKTTFISEVCRQLGSSDEPSSPTFSIVNEYDTTRLGKVYHLDCNRLEGEEEGEEIGVEDYFYSGNVCFVEWPGNIGGLIPSDAIQVEISVMPDGSRELRIYEDTEA